MKPTTRRRFFRHSAGLGAGLALARDARPAGAAAVTFASAWDKTPDRPWIGREYWANPLHEWQVAGGRVECSGSGPDRNLHLLTRQLGEASGDLQASVKVGRVGGGAIGKGKGSAGFRVGINGPLKEFRNSLIFGTGLDAGFADGKLFVGKTEVPVELASESIELRLTVARSAGEYLVSLSAHDVSGPALSAPGPSAPASPAAAERSLAQVSQRVPGPLDGNLALVANYAKAPGGQFWFSDWRLSGSKLLAHDGRAFGPILFTQYAVHAGVLKLSAQMAPIGRDEPQTAKLQLQKGKAWTTVAEEPIHPESRTALFRIASWDASRAVPYRVVWGEHDWAGTVRRDPVDKPVLTVADVSCNTHLAFPNPLYVANMKKLDPDLLAFVGDQFYESSGGYGTTRAPLDLALLDYLRKWYMHGWTWRELTKDRPSVSLPDDHDVYQGNIWGEGGAPQSGSQEKGGYNMHPAWVNTVHRTHASHHPDPFDPTPIKQGISVYYGPLTWGRVSFAILADRMFKSGPEGKVSKPKPDPKPNSKANPKTEERGDHVTEASFDPKTADLPGLVLLGDRQLEFLKAWSADWKGADMKAVLSQTIFTSMATHHGSAHTRLRADYDSNGWPQTQRGRVVREMRKAFAFHIAGDQHLPAVVHYGVDDPRDGGVAFAGPAVNVGFPRWWEPEEPGKNRAPGAPEPTGDFIDHFGNHMAVLAFANGGIKPKGPVLELMQARASGLGVVRFNKKTRKITVECWPYLADPTKQGTQFPGWPVTVDQIDNYGRKASAYLPRLKVTGFRDPVVQVVEQTSGEVLYTVRAPANFRAPVFAPGRYLVRVSDDSGKVKELRDLEAAVS